MLTWQSFTETVLREDGARFALETKGAEDAPLSAWVRSAVQMLKYHHLILACEWEEKTLPVTAGRPVDRQPPAGRWTPPWPAPGQSLNAYASERERAFGRYASALYATAGAAQAVRRFRELPDFLEQLSIQRILEPLPFLDRREPVAPEEMQVALIVDGQYYLLPLSEAEPVLPTPMGVAAVELDRALAAAPRGRQSRLRRLLPQATRAELSDLRRAPILINWDLHDGTLPLGELRRQARRGGNDHPLVLIRTTTGMIFEFSHVIFDARWGLQIAECMTRVAMAPEAVPAKAEARPLRLQAGPKLFRAAKPGPREVAAETTAIALEPIVALSRKAGCTVNDLLLLARWAFAVERGERPPALLVPVDRFPDDPPRRLHLAVIRPEEVLPGPLQPGSEVDLHALHERLREIYAATRRGRTLAYRANQLMVLTPPTLRAMGNWATEQLAWTSDRIKGREVFSNVGRVPSGVSATRFISARGLGDAHDRVWGALTTDQGELYISLRDFRRDGQDPAAAQAYVDQFASFVNRMVEQLL